MTIAGNKINQRQLLIGSLLIVGLIALVFLVRQQQNLRGRANVNPATAFEFQSSDGTGQVTRTGADSFETNTQNIKIKLTDPNILTNP